MRYKCIIIEDQPPAQRILTRYIEDIPELELVGTFTDPVAGLAFLRQHTISLIFLDIHLPKLSGMDLLKILPYQPKVILTTAFSDYALQGYEYDVVDYLLKPISFERFLKAVSKVIYPPDTGSPSPTAGDTSPQPTAAALVPSTQYIFVKSDRTIIKLDTESIISIQSEDDFTRLFTTEKNYFLSYTLKYWLDILPPERFCRIHKSHIINLAFVEKIEGNRVYTPNGPLPIGRSFREDFLARIDVKE